MYFLKNHLMKNGEYGPWDTEETTGDLVITYIEPDLELEL